MSSAFKNWQPFKYLFNIFTIKHQVYHSANDRHRNSANLEENKIDKVNVIKIFDEPVAKPNSIEVTNELETLQNLCLYQEKGNDMRDLLQKFESLHVTNASKQFNVLTFLKENKN